MNLLVTGGCGFIGSNFIRRCLAGHHAVARLVNLDKLTYAGNPANLAGTKHDPRYVFMLGDIADVPLVSDLLQKHQIDAVVNFAAETHVDRSIDSPEPFIRTNVLGVLHLLDACRHHWAKQPAGKKHSFRFLHISTDEVYGSLGPRDPSFTELSPYLPNSPYAASKAAGNHLVRAYWASYHLPTLILNCSNNYGPYQFPEKLIPLMILNALDGKRLPIYGDGQQVRDWLHVDDHAAAIQAVLDKGQTGETYNLGGANERTNLDIVRVLCRLLDAQAPRPDGRHYADQIAFVPDRPGHDRRYAINFSKIQTALGWRPQIAFDTGLAKTVGWYLANRPWCEEITADKYARERLGAPVFHL